MPVRVDPLMPVHPLTVADLARMVEAGILDEDDRVELLDGVLVEMNPQGEPHAHAIRRLTRLLAPLAAEVGLDLNVQLPLRIHNVISQPEPDLAVTPSVPRGEHASSALLVVEISRSSRRLDLGRKAELYAEADIPEYWVLDVERRELVVHRDPRDGRYASVRALGEHDTVKAVAVDLVVSLAELL